MTMTDPISDLLTRIRNANLNRFDKLEVPLSSFKKEIVRVLKEEGYIKDYRVMKDKERGLIKISLKYANDGTRVITSIDRVSRPSLRIYVGRDDVPQVKNGLGTAILSTPKGVMTGKSARREGIGGEVLCYVW